MDMLNNLREFINVNIKSLPVINHQHNATTSPKWNENKKINVNAGSELLSHFAQQWEELHDNNEANARAANAAAELISNIHGFIRNQNEHVSRLNQLLLSTPPLQTMIETCTKQIQQLRTSFEDVEDELLKFECIVNENELQQNKFHHNHQLALYQEKKNYDLEMLRSELSAKHAQLLHEIEAKQRRRMEERQQVFQDAFKTDLEVYKTLGTIPKIPVKQQASALLEEIQLDIDDKELLEFLDDK